MDFGNGGTPKKHAPASLRQFLPTSATALAIICVFTVPIAAQQPLPGTPALVGDPDSARANQQRISRLTCSDILGDLPQRGRPHPYGVPEVEWTNGLVAMLRQRVDECAGQFDRSQRSQYQAMFRVGEADILDRANEARRRRDAAVARKNGVYAQIAAAQKLAPPERERALAQIHEGLSRSGLSQQDQGEIAGALVRARLEAQAAREAHMEEERKVAESRQAQEAAEAEARSRALEARLAGLSAPVRGFITRNETIIQQPADHARAWMRGLYAMETSLRICARETGRYGRELAETTRRRGVFEAFLIEFHRTEPAELKRERDAYGVETGAGRAADMLSADRITVRGACDGALAWSSSFFDFGG